MVNWYNVITLIAGSSLIVSFASIIVNNFIFIPHLDIQIKNATKEGKLPELYNIIITNNGKTSATDLVVTIQPGNSSAVTYEDILSTNGLINKTDIRVSENVFQIKFPRLSPSNGSIISIPYTVYPETVYATYDQGSESSVRLPWYVDLSNLLIQNWFVYIILITGIVLVIIPLLYKENRRRSEKQFLARVAYDMYKVIRDIQKNPRRDEYYWNPQESFFGTSNLLSTKNWISKSKFILTKIPTHDQELFFNFYNKIITRDHFLKYNRKRNPKLHRYYLPEEKYEELIQINQKLLEETKKSYEGISWSKFGIEPTHILTDIDAILNNLWEHFREKIREKSPDSSSL